MEGSVSINGQLTSTDVDASGSPVYALVGAEIPGLTINADGSWLFDPTVSAYDSLQVDQVQTINVSYSVTDDQGSTDQGSFSIELTGTNDAPTASSTDLILASGNEDSVYNINATDLLFNTTDVDNDDLIIKNLALSESSAPNGQLVSNDLNNWSFQPNSDFNGSIDLTYQVEDSNGC